MAQRRIRDNLSARIAKKAAGATSVKQSIRARRPTSLARGPENLKKIVFERAVRAIHRMATEASPAELTSLSAAGSDYEVLTRIVSDFLPESAHVARRDPLAQALARGIDLKERLIAQAGGLLSGERVAELLGIQRQSVAKRRSLHKLLALPTGTGDFKFPACQFDDRGTLPGMDRLLAAFRTDDPWFRLQTILTPDPNLGGQTPLQALREGRAEIAAAAIMAYDDS